jgi:hypothetical protein
MFSSWLKRYWCAPRRVKAPLPRTFRPHLEPLEDRMTPATLEVNTVLDNNMRDGKLSFREALMLTNGTLNNCTQKGNRNPRANPSL